MSLALGTVCDTQSLRRHHINTAVLFTLASFNRIKAQMAGGCPGSRDFEKFTSFSVLQFPHLSTENNYSADLVCLL